MSFELAQYAFADPQRIIAEDTAHSQDEKRYYCFGRIQEGIATVRFTFRGSAIRIIGAGYWRKGKKIYDKENKKIEYTDEPLGDIRIIEDFLPPPEQLLFKEGHVEITLTLSRKSLDFFKREAEKHHTQYQKMIQKTA